MRAADSQAAVREDGLASYPDPEPSRAGLFGGHHVRKWLPAKHRRPQARGAMPGLARRNACKMLVESSARLQNSEANQRMQAFRQHSHDARQRTQSARSTVLAGGTHW